MRAHALLFTGRQRETRCQDPIWQKCTRILAHKRSGKLLQTNSDDIYFAFCFLLSFYSAATLILYYRTQKYALKISSQSNLVFLGVFFSLLRADYNLDGIIIIRLLTPGATYQSEAPSLPPPLQKKSAVQTRRSTNTAQSFLRGRKSSKSVWKPWTTSLPLHQVGHPPDKTHRLRTVLRRTPTDRRTLWEETACVCVCVKGKNDRREKVGHVRERILGTKLHVWNYTFNLIRVVCGGVCDPTVSWKPSSFSQLVLKFLEQVGRFQIHKYVHIRRWIFLFLEIVFSLKASF